MIDIDLDFLGQLEGYSTKGYTLEGYNKSGVTIGTGIDLGQQSKEGLLKAGLSKEEVEVLEPYLGLKGYQAKEMLQRHPLLLSDTDTKRLTQKVIESGLTELIKKFDKDAKRKFEDLSREQQTVILSVTHQFGLNGAPRFLRKAQSDDWQEVEKELRNFGGGFERRRNQEADYLSGGDIKELLKRTREDVELLEKYLNKKGLL